MKIYLDRNIFGDLKELVEYSKVNDDISLLQSAVDEGKVSILLSTTILQETFPLLHHSAKNFREELKVIFRLVEKRRMIKSAKELLREAIESYSFNRKFPDMQRKTPSFLEEFLRTGKVSHELLELKDIALAERENFTDVFNQRFEKVRKQLVEENPNFKEFWESCASILAIDLAKSFNLFDKCFERGIEGLLKIKPIKLYCLYQAHWIFTKLFGEQKVPGKVKAGERGDCFHAVQSSAADIFVTKDKKLERWLKEVPINNFEVINFRQLIERLS